MSGVAGHAWGLRISGDLAKVKCRDRPSARGLGMETHHEQRLDGPPKWRDSGALRGKLLHRCLVHGAGAATAMTHAAEFEPLSGVGRQRLHMVNGDMSTDADCATARSMA